MNPPIAILDLGTNTFHLLIAKLIDGKMVKLFESQQHVKPGEGGINKGYIADDAYERGINALRSFKVAIDKFQVAKIIANGTAALRTASNGKQFTDQVLTETGIAIQIIPGSLEATLIYKGVNLATNLNPSALIMDIGGGSVEFIFCNADQIYWKKSYPVGAAKLMAAYHHTDPLSPKNLEQLETHLLATLSELKEQAEYYKPHKLVGSAGAFETFYALVKQDQESNPVALPPLSGEIPIQNLDLYLNKIIQSNHHERANNDLIIPVRTDMIVVAAVLTRLILQLLDIKSVELSRYSLKEGLFIDAWQ